MKVKIILLICVILINTNLFSQDFNNSESNAIAGASGTIQNITAIGSNIASLATVKDTVVQASFQNKYKVLGLNQIRVAACLPLKNGVLGLSLSRFGDQIYNQSYASIGYAHQINQISLGIQGQYIQNSISEYGNQSTLIFNFGGLAKVNNYITFSGFVYNIFQTKIKNQDLPSILTATITVSPSEKVKIHTQLDKNIYHPEILKLGLEYNLNQYLALRTGIQVKPFAGCGGIGFKFQKYSFDYSCGYHPRLGVTNSFSLSYFLNKSFS